MLLTSKLKVLKPNKVTGLMDTSSTKAFTINAKTKVKFSKPPTDMDNLKLVLKGSAPADSNVRGFFNDPGVVPADNPDLLGWAFYGFLALIVAVIALTCYFKLLKKEKKKFRPKSFSSLNEKLVNNQDLL